MPEYDQCNNGKVCASSPGIAGGECEV